MKRIAAVVAVAALAAVGSIAFAGQAGAHDASISSDCDGYAVAFANFPEGANTATVNGQTVSWTGASHTASFSHPVNEGDPDYPIDVSWSADGGGSESGVQSSKGCEPPTTTTTTEEQIEVCRDGKVITIPASELQEGDTVDDCPIVEPPTETVIVVPGPPVAVPAPPGFTG